jgi:hypothetical protein
MEAVDQQMATLSLTGGSRGSSANGDAEKGKGDPTLPSRGENSSRRSIRVEVWVNTARRVTDAVMRGILAGTLIAQRSQQSVKSVNTLDRKSGGRKSVKYVDDQESVDNESECDDVLGIHTVDENPRKPYEVCLTFAGKDLCMNVDTGANVSVLSKEWYDRDFGHVPLKPSEMKLKAYGGDR